MVSNSAKLDSRTKQHTQSGVSTSDSSRDIAATKSWWKKRKKLKKKKNNEANWMVSYSAKQDRFSVALYATEERSPELWSNETL